MVRHGENIPDMTTSPQSGSRASAAMALSRPAPSRTCVAIGLTPNCGAGGFEGAEKENLRPPAGAASGVKQEGDADNFRVMSFNNWSHFPIISASKFMRPVALPPTLPSFEQNLDTSRLGHHCENNREIVVGSLFQSPQRKRRQARSTSGDEPSQLRQQTHVSRSGLPAPHRTSSLTLFPSIQPKLTGHLTKGRKTTLSVVSCRHKDADAAHLIALLRTCRKRRSRRAPSRPMNSASADRPSHR